MKKLTKRQQRLIELAIGWHKANAEGGDADFHYCDENVVELTELLKSTKIYGQEKDEEGNITITNYEVNLPDGDRIIFSYMGGTKKTAVTWNATSVPPKYLTDSENSESQSSTPNGDTTMKNELKPCNSTDAKLVLEAKIEAGQSYNADALRAFVIEAGFDPDMPGKKNVRLHQAISAMRKTGRLDKDAKGNYSLNQNWVPKATSIKGQPVIVEPENPDWDEIDGKIAKLFKILKRRVSSCVVGRRKSIIVSGAPGLGKSYGIWKQLEKEVKNEDNRFHLTSKCTPIQLYMSLFEYREKGQVLLVDDCDQVLQDQDGLNLIKAATETAPDMERRLCWKSSSRVLQDNDVPPTFVYEGSVIFISNINYENSVKQAEHISAVLSRTGMVNLNCWQKCQKLVRIEQVANDSKFLEFDALGIKKADQKKIMKFIRENYLAINSKYLTLRLPGDLAGIFVECEGDWDEFVEDAIESKFANQ